MVSQLLVGGLLFGTLTVLGYFFFVLTPWGQEWDYLSFKGHVAITPRFIGWSGKLMTLVNFKTLVVASVALVGISLYRRRPLLGVLALVAIFFAITGTAFFKKTLPRPSFGNSHFYEWEGLFNESYPSGHTTFATVIALSFVLVSAPRFRPWVASAAALVSTLFGFGVIFVGGHRPADPMGAILWCTFCMTLAALIAIHFRRGLWVREPNSAALATGMVLCLAPALATLFCIKGVSLTFLPLFPMLALIALTAFAGFSWLAWMLSGDDSPEHGVL